MPVNTFLNRSYNPISLQDPMRRDYHNKSIYSNRLEWLL